jgi:subtilisin family serine protease
MLEMEKVHDRKPQGYVRDSYKSIKIAVLDTGIDWKHSSMRAAKKQNRLKALKSFVKGDESVDDLHGHGTHVAALLLKVAPDSQLYIAKVASGGKIPADHNIADVSKLSCDSSCHACRLTSSQALKWAIECDIDIITMSFGIDRDHVAMQDQIREAYHKDIIMFAAASNRGHNYPVPFPARRSEVLCIYATDGKGYPYNGNPSLETADCHFATLGVAVKSAWPEHLLPDHPSDRSGERRMTGTSLATPIVAGIAAYILDFAHVQEIDDDSYRMLRSRDGMKKIFSQLLVTKNDGLDYIHPWKLFTDYRTEDSDVLFLIKDTLAQWVGSPKSAELCD